MIMHPKYADKWNRPKIRSNEIGLGGKIWGLFEVGDVLSVIVACGMVEWDPTNHDNTATHTYLLQIAGSPWLEN